MGKKYNLEYIIIGSGPAGTAAAVNLAKTKKRVALVEAHQFGGSNLNTRDIPYSTSLNFAHTCRTFLNFPEIKNQELSLNFPSITAHRQAVVSELNHRYQEKLAKAHVVFFNGCANFLDSHTIAIGNEKFTAENFIIATGSHLNVTNITGIEQANFLTPDTALDIRRRPEVALIVGAGSTGCEIANYYAELGIKVILIEAASRILPREDSEVSSVISNYFTNHLGITVLPSSTVVAIEQDEISKRVIFKNSRTEKMVRVDCVILATGSKPSLDLGLENAKVKYKDTGIIVDKYFQTSAKNIYAIGDCLGKDYSSTNHADYEGTLLASNLVNKTKNVPNYGGFIRITETYPEIACVGPNELELIKRKRKYKKSLVNIAEIPASQIKNFGCGFVKLLVGYNNHVIGATIVSPNATLIAEEISIAARHNLSVLELASTPHSINSYNYAIKLAAKKIVAQSAK